jgi:transcriptional regulator with XRE-family HTH domain
MTVATNRPDADKALGRAIHQAMWDQHITQLRLAEALGIDQSALSKKLRGLRPWLFAEFISCADLLGLDARDLLSQMWGPHDAPTPTISPGNIDFHGSASYGVRHLPTRGNTPLARAA